MRCVEQNIFGFANNDDVFVTHQMTVEFKLLQVPLRPTTMNQSPYNNGGCKRPRNTKRETIHKKATIHLIYCKKGEHITIND